jgi:hypothetical protein
VNQSQIEAIRAEIERICSIPIVLYPYSAPAPAYPFGIIQFRELRPVGSDDAEVDVGITYQLRRIVTRLEIVAREEDPQIPFLMMTTALDRLFNDPESNEILASQLVTAVDYEVVYDASDLVGGQYDKRADCDIVWYVAELITQPSERAAQWIQSVEVTNEETGETFVIQSP